MSLKMPRYKFCNTTNKEFANTLKQRVNDYFKENQLDRTGDWRIIFKSILVFTAYFATYFAILFSGVTHIGGLFLMWGLLGLGAAMIGTVVMHDSLHGTLSKHRKVNDILGFSAAVVGISGRMWKFQHNVLHHSFTNVKDMDTDIDAGAVFRFAPHQARRWYHRFQVFYAPFLYGLMTLVWVAVKDFATIKDFRNRGLFRNDKEVRKEVWTSIAKKLGYFAVFLFIPMFVVDTPFWATILMFVAMHFVCGLYLAIVFQTAHVMPEAHFEAPPEPKIKENWLVHQMLTTANFAPKNKALSWVLGGLNYQVEHHLFPNISHIHYPKISKIVKRTAQEYNIPYYTHPTFFKAITLHFKHLYKLGKETQPVPVMAR